MTSDQTNAFMNGAGFSPTSLSVLIVWITLGAFYGFCAWILVSEYRLWANQHSTVDRLVVRFFLVGALAIFFSTLL